VHHRAIQINHQPDATVFQFIILTFVYSLTCFGRFPAHHQELNGCSGGLWFYLRIVVTAVLCSWSGWPAGRPDHEHITLQHGGRNCCNFFPDVLFQIHRCPWFLFVHLALEISSEEEVLRPRTLVPMNIEVPTKYPLSQDRIVVFENRLHSKSPMLYRPALHGN
jgi:hypothetical protein